MVNLNLYGPIGTETRTAAAVRAALDGSCQPVDVRIYSDGGDAVEGLAIANARAGRQNESIEAWQRLRVANPQDADVKNVFKSAPLPH
jgi:hypothetical protein